MKQSSYVTRKYPWKSCITRCCRFSIFSSWFQRLWSGSADSMKSDGFRFLRAFTVRSSNVRFFVHGDSPIMLSLPYLSKAPCAKSFSSAYYSQSLLCSNSLPSWWHGSESTSSSSRDRWHPGTVAASSVLKQCICGTHGLKFSPIISLPSPHLEHHRSSASSDSNQSLWDWLPLCIRCPSVLPLVLDLRPHFPEVCFE